MGAWSDWGNLRRYKKDDKEDRESCKIDWDEKNQQENGQTRNIYENIIGKAYEREAKIPSAW
jgi:hypothetical protein